MARNPALPKHSIPRHLPARAFWYPTEEIDREREIAGRLREELEKG